MTVYEADLPGVGKKFEVDLDERQLVIIIHNTGKREVFVRPDPDADSEKVFELTDREARQVGTILEGAYFQPVEAGTIDTVLDENTLIDWVGVDDDSWLAGLTLGEADLRRRSGVSVLAVQRGEETITNPDATTDVRAGDTLIVLGSRSACEALEELVADGERSPDA